MAPRRTGRADARGATISVPMVRLWRQTSPSSRIGLRIKDGDPRSPLTLSAVRHPRSGLRSLSGVEPPSSATGYELLWNRAQLLQQGSPGVSPIFRLIIGNSLLNGVLAAQKHEERSCNATGKAAVRGSPVSILVKLQPVGSPSYLSRTACVRRARGVPIT